MKSSTWRVKMTPKNQIRYFRISPRNINTVVMLDVRFGLETVVRCTMIERMLCGRSGPSSGPYK